MKPFVIALLTLLAAPALAQSVVLAPPGDSPGKIEFKTQAMNKKPDYSTACKLLTDEVYEDPKNAELHYFLGYALDRLHADDGTGMMQRQKDKTIRASEEFETVIRLEPNYKGEMIVLDPYAKLSSIWGSLAQAYLARKQTDSAKWAFREGKKRGGFLEPVLELNRQLLNSCDKNAILVTYGDNITISCWYLQLVENYRTDVTTVDANLVNANWYNNT